MSLNFPVYLIRVLSSAIVGLLIFSISLLDLYLYINIADNKTNKQVFNIIHRIIDNIARYIKTSNSLSLWLFLFLPLCFLIGEIFSDLSEMFIFDPIYNNVRVKQDSHYLEYLNPIIFLHMSFNLKVSTKI